MDHQNRRYQSNHHRSQQRNQAGPAFANSTSSSINHNSYHRHPTSRRSSNCTASICYSYLIAIFSSFLVVLGIYLALTKFNARFLYISLTGLLIEALGACLFCISTIRRSRLAQYKQTIDEPGSENEMISNRQQQARAVTHILTNRTLNNRTAIQISNNNHVDDDNGVNHQQLNIEIRPPIENSIVTKTQNQSTNSRTRATDSAQVRGQPSDTEAPNCQDLPDDGRQAQQSHEPNVQHGCERSSSLSSESSTIRAELDESQDSNYARKVGFRNNSENAAQTMNHSEQIDKPQTSASNKDPDLSRQAQAQAQAQVQSPKRNPRPAKIRRTLVMGLSGEEEVIEIDEQDLDEMSIFPPSYESIATDSKKYEQKLQQQQGQ